jgi:hypothetical protein
MIILCVGMPRAGSGWHYNLIHDLVVAGGGKKARDIRQKYHLEKILTEVNCNVGALTMRRLFSVLPASLAGNTFTIKAHSGATAVGDLFMNTGWMKATYIYRDPRDALLSAMDFGKRTLEKGHPNAFSHLTTLDESIEFMLKYCEIWESWVSRKAVLSARYEDLLTDYDSETNKLIDLLALDKKNPAVITAIEKYRPGQAKEGRDGLHFYKGQVGRFRERFSPEEQKIMADRFAPYLNRMGYEI